MRCVFGGIFIFVGLITMFVSGLIAGITSEYLQTKCVVDHVEANHRNDIFDESVEAVVYFKVTDPPNSQYQTDAHSTVDDWDDTSTESGYSKSRINIVIDQYPTGKNLTCWWSHHREELKLNEPHVKRNSFIALYVGSGLTGCGLLVLFSMLCPKSYDLGQTQTNSSDKNVVVCVPS